MAETTFDTKKALVAQYLGFKPFTSIRGQYYRQIKGNIQHLNIEDIYLNSNLLFEALEQLSKDGFTIKTFLNNPYKLLGKYQNCIIVEKNTREICRKDFVLKDMKIAYWEAIMETLKNPF